MFYSSWCPGDARERGEEKERRSDERRDGTAEKGQITVELLRLRERDATKPLAGVPNPVMAIIERVKNPRVERERSERLRAGRKVKHVRDYVFRRKRR